MSGKQKFYVCELCGMMVGVVKEANGSLVCCGEEMTELEANTVEASVEKHLPTFTVSGDSITVQVGSAPHPMEEAHHIAFVYVETENGGQRKCLKVGEAPEAKFAFSGDKPVAVYAYCNLHGLWKAEIK